MQSRNGNPGGVPKRPARPGGVPKRPERTINAMQVELDEKDQQLVDQQQELDKLRAMNKVKQAKDRKRQEKNPNNTDTINEWGASSDDTDYEYDDNDA